MGKDKQPVPLFQESSPKKKQGFHLFGIGIGRGSGRDKDRIDNQLDSDRLRKLSKEWMDIDDFAKTGNVERKRLTREDAQRLDLLRVRIVKECLQILENINRPGSYRNLLETASCLYYEAARYRIYELIEMAKKYEQIAVHQLRLPAPSEDVRRLFIGLPKARVLSQELSDIVSGDVPFNEANVNSIAEGLIDLYYDFDENKISPYDMGRISSDCSAEHTEFNTLTLGGWITAQLLVEAKSLGVTDYASYIRLAYRLEVINK